jgi:hypothetical protein
MLLGQIYELWRGYSRHDPHVFGVFQRILNLNSVLRKYQKKTNWGIFCKIIHQYFSEVSIIERQFGRQIAPPFPQTFMPGSWTSIHQAKLWDCGFGGCYANVK